MKKLREIFGRVYAAPAPVKDDPEPDEPENNGENDNGYPNNLREENDGDEPIECVYAGPDYFGVKDEPEGSPENCDHKEEPMACVYAGPKGFFKKKRRPDIEAIGAVYAGPDYFASKTKTDGDPMSGVYAGPMGIGMGMWMSMGMGQGQDQGVTRPIIEDDGMPPHVVGIVPASIPPENIAEREANKIKCPGCGHRVPFGMKFCPECGTQIDYKGFCPECGADVNEGTKFCPECGHRLDTEK